MSATATSTASTARARQSAREANDEFKDAVVALSAMDQARREFDPATMTLFKGERETCSSKVFGVLNCCKGKGFPLIPGIQLLVALGCGREEILLHQRDAQGLCAYVGTYCSSSFLGVCLTKKKVYCCFESKLTRILQEQGRAQLPKPWDKPKSEQCLGFTLDEFARLDLSAGWISPKSTPSSPTRRGSPTSSRPPS
jgi:conjugal transfer mating pair stabilization protein TraN